MNQNARSLIRNLAWPACATLIALSAVLMVCGAYARLDGAITSDDLSLVEMLDKLAGGASVAGWHQPEAPSFFPDVVLLAPCRLIFTDVGLLFTAYSIALYAVTILALAWLAHELGFAWRTGWILGCMGVALLLAVNLRPSSIALTFLTRPGGHMGLVPIGFCLAAFFLRSLSKGFGIWVSIAWIIVGGLTAFSDHLLIMQFLAPIAGTMVLLRVLRQISTRQLVAGLGIVGLTVAASELFALPFALCGLRPMVLGDSLAICSLADLWQNLTFVWTYYLSQPEQLLVNVICAAMCALVLITALRSSTEGKSSVTTLALALLISFAWLGGLLPPLLTGGARPGAFVEYDFVLLVVPPLLLGVLGLLAATGRSARFLAIGQVVVVVFVLGELAAECWRSGPPQLRQPYPELAQVLDQLSRERGCRRGLAGYWNARRLHYLTHEHVALLPSWRDGRPCLYNHNPDDWLSSDPQSLECPDYQFVVVGPDGESPNGEGPTALAIRQEFGAPTERIAAGEHEVWLYDRLASGRFQAFLGTVLARRYERTGVWVAPLRPDGGRELGQPKTEFGWKGTVWDLDYVGQAEFTFAEAATGRLLDFAGDGDAAYTITFLNGAEEIGTVEVPPVEWYGKPANYGPPGMRSRLIPLPPPISDRKWDRVIISNPSVRRVAPLGHFLVFGDGSSLEALAVPARPRRQRFEAEGMPTLLSTGDRGKCRMLTGDLDGLRCLRPWLLRPCPDATTMTDPTASNGLVRYAAPHEAGYLVVGPNIQLQAGSYRVDFALKADSAATTDAVATIEVTVGGRPPLWAARQLSGRDFALSGRDQVFSLQLEVLDTLDAVEFRIFCHGHSAVWADYVDLISLDGGQPGPSSGTDATPHSEVPVPKKSR